MGQTLSPVAPTVTPSTESTTVDTAVAGVENSTVDISGAQTTESHSLSFDPLVDTDVVQALTAELALEPDKAGLDEIVKRYDDLYGVESDFIYGLIEANASVWVKLNDVIHGGGQLVNVDENGDVQSVTTVDATGVSYATGDGAGVATEVSLDGDGLTYERTNNEGNNADQLTVSAAPSSDGAAVAVESHQGVTEVVTDVDGNAVISKTTGEAMEREVSSTDITGGADVALDVNTNGEELEVEGSTIEVNGGYATSSTTDSGTSAMDVAGAVTLDSNKDESQTLSAEGSYSTVHTDTEYERDADGEIITDKNKVAQTVETGREETEASGSVTAPIEGDSSVKLAASASHLESETDYTGTASTEVGGSAKVTVPTGDSDSGVQVSGAGSYETANTQGLRNDATEVAGTAAYNGTDDTMTVGASGSVQTGTTRTVTNTEGEVVLDEHGVPLETAGNSKTVAGEAELVVPTVASEDSGVEVNAEGSYTTTTNTDLSSKSSTIGGSGGYDGSAGTASAGGSYSSTQTNREVKRDAAGDPVTNSQGVVQYESTDTTKIAGSADVTVPTTSDPDTGVVIDAAGSVATTDVDGLNNDARSIGATAGYDGTTNTADATVSASNKNGTNLTTTNSKGEVVESTLEEYNQQSANIGVSHTSGDEAATTVDGGVTLVQQRVDQSGEHTVTRNTEESVNASIYTGEAATEAGMPASGSASVTHTTTTDLGQGKEKSTTIGGTIGVDNATAAVDTIGLEADATSDIEGPLVYGAVEGGVSNPDASVSAAAVVGGGQGGVVAGVTGTYSNDDLTANASAVIVSPTDGGVTLVLNTGATYKLGDNASVLGSLSLTTSPEVTAWEAAMGIKNDHSALTLSAGAATENGVNSNAVNLNGRLGYLEMDLGAGDPTMLAGQKIEGTGTTILDPNGRANVYFKVGITGHF